MPGPFINGDEINRYLLLKVDDDMKNECLSGQVRYARISYISLKPTAVVFHLERNHKNLTTEEYSEYLIAYLNNAHCCKTITVEDLSNLMHGIMSWSMDLIMKTNKITVLFKLQNFQYNWQVKKIPFSTRSLNM